MDGEKRTALGDTLRLQLRYRKLKCEVEGPKPATGEYRLKIPLFSSETGDDEKAASAAEILPDMRKEMDEHGIAWSSIDIGYGWVDKQYVLFVNFPPDDLMAAYEYQLQFGQRGPSAGR